MTRTSHNLPTIEIATRLGDRCIAIAAVEVKTPDGRTWSIEPVASGRGRRSDGSWGPVPGAGGGFRLFEIDPHDGRGPDEHDAVEGDTWDMGDLLDYLEAVASSRTKPNQEAAR